MSGVHHQAIPGDAGSLRPRDPLAQIGHDLSGHVVVVRTLRLTARHSVAVSDYQGGAARRHDARHLRVRETTRVIDDGCPGLDAAPCDFCARGIDRDHHVAALTDGGDHWHYPVDLLGKAHRVTATERHSPDIHPVGAVGRRGQRGGHCPVEREGCSLVEKGVRGAVDYRHHRDLSVEVEAAPSDDAIHPHRLAMESRIPAERRGLGASGRHTQEVYSLRADTGAMSDGPKILIVDDEPNIRDLLTTSLRFAGFAVRAVGNGAQAISAVLEEEPDLIILDVMLPDMNGFGVTKRLRSSGYTSPILFLTAKDDTEDKITGLTVGGDDYVTKPFSLDEIVARIKAILRRTMQDEEDAIIRAGELTMDQDTHEVTIGSEQIELSPTEFKLLRYLMLNPNRVLSKAQILDHVWEYDFNGDAGIVESYISYLRRKLDQYSQEPVIQTKRGFGYMLKAARV